MGDLKDLKDFNIYKDMDETKNKTRMISNRISTRPSSHILERSHWLWINITSFIRVSEMRGVASMSRSINRLLQHPDCWSSSMNDYLFISGDNIYFFDTPLGIVNNSSCSLMLHRHLRISSFLSNIEPLLLQFVGDCKRLQSLKCNLDTFFQLISCENISSICITSLYLTNLAEKHVYDQTELELLDTWGLKMPYVRHLICQLSTSELRVATNVIRGIQYLRGIYSIHMIGDNGYGYEVDVEDEHVGREWTSLIQDVSRYAPYIFELRLDRMTKGVFDIVLSRFSQLKTFWVSEYRLNQTELMYELLQSQWDGLMDRDFFHWTQLDFILTDTQRHEVPIPKHDSSSIGVRFIGVLKEHCYLAFTPVFFLIHSHNLQHVSFSKLIEISICIYAITPSLNDSLTSVHLATVFQSLVNLKSFKAEFSKDPRFNEELEWSLLIKLLRACTSLPIGLEVFDMPLGGYPIYPEHVDLVTLFSRFKSLKQLFLRDDFHPHQFYYTQRYMSSLLCLEELWVSGLHHLTYSQRILFMEDLPVSLREIGSMGFCMYKFSLLEDGHTIEDWWSQYILRLPLLECQFMYIEEQGTHPVLVNIGRKLIDFCSEYYSLTCRVCTKYDHHIYCAFEC
ncbi:MAG: hypothetical protein Sylvanvirus2_36 [Sylvanvirus sp.]|uniref:Uncharacterized protein n=1 Tax=Sylvanvirus sp. TaxID=2487774 RepID=A0A3G5AHA7_9VIRU|nr:MAG: hypothetical protein Sylvanvirus2_36 [Sylvanvirus sp.]